MASADSKPVPDLSLVPAALRERDRWLCWRREVFDEKPTKVPVHPITGMNASVTDPTNLFSFETATAAAAEHGHDGVGFVFVEGEGLCGIDLDNCIDENGVMSVEAREIIDSFGSYTEISPSGRGVKIFIRATKPTTRCKVTNVPGMTAAEVYDGKRMFTVTARHLEGTPLVVEDRQAELDAFCARIFPAKPAAGPTTPAVASFAADPDDDRLLDRARHAANGAKFAALYYRGDTSGHGGDDSAADLALCSLLWFWTGDVERVDRLFRRSALYRPKWERPDYRAATLAKAAEGEVMSARTGVAGHVPAEGSTSATPAIDPANLDGSIALGERDPDSGRLVLSPRRTLPTAQAFTREFHDHPDGITLRGYGGMMLEWNGNRYREVEDESLKLRLQPWLHHALRFFVSPTTGRLTLRDFESNPATIKAAFDTVRTYTHLSIHTPIPSWLDDGKDRPDPAELLACRSNNIHIPSGLVIPATPALFTTNALEFDYNANAEPPERWTKFLEQVFGEDIEAVRALQEWMGYCLTPDTSQQKILLMVGPKRSGKGTIVRVLSRLVGLGNVAAPTTSSLAGPFGLQPLLGKSLATINDARFKGESVATTIERLLTISGEDFCTIDIKHKPSITTKLKTRFTIVSNELPRLTDAAGALANRFLILRLTRTFFDREDPHLTEKLCEELPGILLWAIDGWKRLRARGRFVQPASSTEAVRDLEDLSSPVAAFVRDRCVVGTGHRVDTDVLFREYQAWCQAEGIEYGQTKPMFGRDLAAAFPSVTKGRDSTMTSFYRGLTIKGGIDVPV